MPSDLLSRCEAVSVSIYVCVGSARHVCVGIFVIVDNCFGPVQCGIRV